jgi:hypothetical protein
MILLLCRLVKGIAMPPHFRFGPLTSFAFSRKVVALATVTALAIIIGSIGCMGLDTSGRNASLAHEGTVSIPPNSTVEVVYPAPFAAPPTLTIYAWHADWKIVDQNEKSFKIFNKNTSKARSVEWKARGLRVMQNPPKAEMRVISTPLTTAPPVTQRPP